MESKGKNAIAKITSGIKQCKIKKSLKKDFLKKFTTKHSKLKP